MHYRIFLVLFFFFIYMNPSNASESLNVWELKMDFHYSEKTMENFHENDLTMKLCNPTDKIITYRDDIRIGKPAYTVAYEIKGKSDIATMINASHVKLGQSKSSFDWGIVNLKGGECKTYGFSSYGYFYAYYIQKVRKERGLLFYQNREANNKRDLSQDHFDALLPKSFRVHVTIMQGDDIDAKAKGVTFRSDWYDITGDWFADLRESKTLFQPQ